jgi:hypothetical protein
MAAPRLTNVIRLDSIPLVRASFTPEGYLKDKPVLTSTGIFEYHNADGSVRRELRLPEDVFAEESLKSYRGKPVIITHDAGLVTKDNVHENQIGTILSDGFRSGNDVRAEIIIHDTDEMKASGLKELSLGYNLDLDETPGVWNGQKYDAIQRNIRINHLALVHEARAGEQARLNIDGRDSEKYLKGGKVMKKAPKKSRRADSVLSPEELAKAIEEYKARREKRIADKQDAEETETNPVPAVEEDEDEENTAAAPASQDKDVVSAVDAVKKNQDRRDEEGDPENLEQANGTIAKMDEDIGTLLDIIDTLLAERDFKNADEDDEESAETVEDGGEEENPAPFGEDEDDEDTDNTVVAEDEDDEENNCDEDDDAIPSTDDTELKPGEVLNADSIDRIVRQRIQVGMVGRALNMDGLENINIKAAKKAIIRAVRPDMRLDGKSRAYIDAAFSMAADEVSRRNKKDTSYQKRQMFNKDAKSNARRGTSSADRRNAMIHRHNKKEEK